MAANGELLGKRGNGRFVQLLSVGGSMRWREGGRGKVVEGKVEQKEICGDYSVSTRPETERVQSPEPTSAQRAGEACRDEKAGGGVSDEKWCYPGP